MFRRNADIMRRAFVLLLTVGILAVGPALATAADADQGAVGDWLTRYAGARTVGLGGAFVAVADDAGGSLWNPAGLRWLDRDEFQAGTVRLYDDTAINSLSFALPLSGRTSAGLSFLSLGSSGFEKTDELNDVIGDFDANDTAFLLSAAYGVSENISVGANLKVLHQSIEDYSATGVGADLGAQLAVTPDLRLGLALLNVGGPTLTLRERDEKPPTELRGGAAMHLFDDAGLVSVEIAHRDGWGSTLRAGAEVWLMSRAALRIGYYDNDVAGGVGYRFAQGWQFDYGVSDHELGIMHRFGFTVQFGGYHALSQATPEIFSPTGTNPVTRFALQARTKSEAREWQLTIIDTSANVVRTFGGQGAPPAQILWDGKDASGLPLPDGIYRYWLTVRDDRGREVSDQERSVEIATNGPEVSVPVVTQ